MCHHSKPIVEACPKDTVDCGAAQRAVTLDSFDQKLISLFKDARTVKIVTLIDLVRAA